MSSDRDPTLTVVTRGFPPQVSGSPILLANLLSNYAGNVNAVVGNSAYSQVDPAFQPPCPVRYLSFPCTFPIFSDRLGRRLPRLFSRCLHTSIRRALSKLGTKVVLAAFPHEAYVVAAFLAARQLHVPFYVHMHDLWIENAPTGTATARFAASWEPVVLKQAARVLCMTEAMQQYYEKKYGIQTYLLPHCIPEQNYLRAPAEMHPPRMAKPTVLFVGGVSPQMNLDALKALAAASELLPEGYELLFCTSLDPDTLKRFGIHSRRLRAKYVSREEVQRLQSESHVLVAPLSHKNGSMYEVQTVFSTKLLEYLISGRPIVVFAPEGSYHVESARKNGWGYVVTEDSPLALAAAIMKVVTDERLAAGLVRGALREAQSRRAMRHAARLQEWVHTDAQPSLSLQRIQ
jgi:glycosyltransferase involved in cell wall biosynthesis